MKFLLSGLLMITCLTVFGQVEKKTTFGFKGGLNQSFTVFLEKLALNLKLTKGFLLS